MPPPAAFRSAAPLRAALCRPRPLVLAFFVAAAALFAVRIGIPHGLMFDEVHYVPAARALLALEGPRNIEHPLGGKALIALGIALLGDNSLGWRLPSALAGAVVVAGSVAIAFLVWRRPRPAVLAGLAVLANFTTLVQARIAMLDGFMAAFTVAGVAALLWAMRAPDGRRAWRRWIGGAALLGLAVGCKWTALPYLGFAGIGFLWVRTGDARAAGRPAGSALFGAQAGGAWRHWPGLHPLPALFALGLVAGGVYLLTFLPAFFYRHDPLTAPTLLPFQLRMLHQQTQVLPPHTYGSRWWTWPLDIRPIWYLYEVADGAQRGVLMIGNPAVLWAALLAGPACAWAGLLPGGDRRLAGVAGLWIASVLMWAAIPKSPSFFYYSYLSTIWAALPIAGACDRWARGRLAGWDEAWATCALALLVFFYPILAAAPLAGPASFRHWMWFASWM